MKQNTIISILLALSLIVLASFFRLPALGYRVLHTDEANQIHKTGRLLDTGEYRYDPDEHHGPTLYYMALPIIHIAGATSYVESHEWQYRLVPVLFGLGLVFLTLLCAEGLGRKEAYAAAVITALSPAMVYYSRYYIQEMLLVFFTLAAILTGYRYIKTARIFWLLISSIMLGLMHATKETCVLAWFAIGCGLIAVVWFNRHQGNLPGEMQRFRIHHILLAFCFFSFSSVLLFTSFLAYPRGILDSILTYWNYLHKAGGGGHEQPSYYYLSLLAYSRFSRGPWWSEGIVLLLALVGSLRVIIQRKTGFPAFLLVYSLVLALVYAIIPYKTPWCLLGFYHGFILLAGYGIIWLLEIPRKKLLKAGLAVLLFFGIFHLGYQAWHASFTYGADYRNPYAYAHTSQSLLRLTQRMDDIAIHTSPDDPFYVYVIATDGDYWPLPWYLRKYPSGYWDRLPDILEAPVIITSNDLAMHAHEHLELPYHSEMHGLRPAVLLTLFIRQDIWTAFIAQREGSQKQ